MTKKILALAMCLLIVQTTLAMGRASAFNTSFNNFISASSALAIQTGRVEGTVSDPTGAKVARAQVRLSDATGAMVAEATTDNEGRFAFNDIAPGIYFLSVDADGFVLRDRLSIDIKAGQGKKIDVRLEVAAISEQVEVSSTDPIYTQLRQIKLSGEVASLKNVVLKRDAATITFKDGQIFFLAPVEGRVTGAVFIGDGEFQITPPLEIEKKQISHLTGTGSLTEQFSKIVFRFTDKTHEELKKQIAVSQGQAASNAQEAYDEVKNKLRRGNFAYNLDGRILTDLTMPNPQGIFHAYFSGKKYGDWVFGVDPMGGPIVAPEEVFLINTTQGNFGIWGAFHINQHYRSPLVFDEDHRLFDILHYNIDSTIKGKHLEATARARIKTLVDGTRVLPLDLYRTIKVSKVTDASGRDLKFIREEKNEDRDFFVILPEPLKKDQEFELVFTYGGEEVVLDSGGGNFALNPGARSNWYPNNAVTSFGDRSTFELTFRTAKGLVMVATGQPLEEKTEGDTTITRWKSDVSLQVAGFNFGKFKKTVVQDEKTKFAFESYANRELPDELKQLQSNINMAEADGGSTATTLQSLNTTSLMDKARAEAQVSVQLFSNVFGNLPYGRVAITQQPFPNFGQAWPMLVYLPWTAYLDQTHRHQLGMTAAAGQFRTLSAHEVAHQWWGHLLGWNSYRDQWMSEGFAQFSASLYAQVVYKDPELIRFWKEEREQIMAKNRQGKKPSEVGSVYMGLRLNTAKTGFNVYQSVAYPKGGFILHMIRMMMWEPKTRDQRFITMMQDFVKTHYNSDVSTQDFQRAVEKHMTKDMDLDGDGKMNWFFKQYVFGTYIPDYKLEYRIEGGEGGQAVLVGKVTQSNVDDTFKMRVPLYADIDGRVIRLGVLSLFGNSSTDEFRVPLPKKPKKVMLNYFEDVLATTSGS